VWAKSFALSLSLLASYLRVLRSFVFVSSQRSLLYGGHAHIRGFGFVRWGIGALLTCIKMTLRVVSFLARIMERQAALPLTTGGRSALR
jgi:hypothetical protein